MSSKQTSRESDDQDYGVTRLAKSISLQNWGYVNWFFLLVGFMGFMHEGEISPMKSSIVQLAGWYSIAVVIAYKRTFFSKLGYGLLTLIAFAIANFVIVFDADFQKMSMSRSSPRAKIENAKMLEEFGFDSPSERRKLIRKKASEQLTVVMNRLDFEDRERANQILNKYSEEHGVSKIRVVQCLYKETEYSFNRKQNFRFAVNGCAGKLGM